MSEKQKNLPMSVRAQASGRHMTMHRHRDYHVVEERIHRQHK